MTIQKKKQSTGRKCSVCNNDKASEINRLIAKGISFRAISRRIFGSDEARCSIGRHSENCLQLDSTALIKQIKVKRAIDHHAEITEQLEFAKDLRIAARKYLTNPETGELDLIPRADEIDVVYDDYSDLTPKGNPKKKTDTLDILLQRAEDGNVEPKRTIIKHVDIRSFALDSIRTTDGVLDKFAKVQGLYKKEAENPDKLQLVVKFIDNCFSQVEQKAAADPNETFEFTRTQVIEAFCLKCNVSPELVAPLVRECLLLED